MKSPVTSSLLSLALAGGATLPLTLSLMGTATAAATDQAALVAKLAAAKKGSVVQLEPRTYEAGDLVVPEGVTLRGAGYGLTTIDATGHKTGLVIRGGKGTGISDLAVRGARETGVLVSGASGATLSRLKVVSNLTGLLVTKAIQARLENLVVAKNRTGLGMTGDSDSVVVNCSFVDNPSIAVTIAGGTHVAVFNNLFVNSPTAVYTTRNNVELALDYNFYVASFFGKMEGEVSRTTLPGWQRVSGKDAHSVSMPITFADPIKDDYHCNSTLFWAPNLATTADWGTSTLLGFAAPKTDIEGHKRSGDPDLGAFESALAPDRKPDGSFEITSDDGVKSAGLYNADGVSVATFFQNKPLHKGVHPFWLPSRDNHNQPLPAGDYQVKVVESQLSNDYLGLAGNFGVTSNRLDNCSWAEERFAFDDKDRIYIAQNAFENGMGVRAFDANYATPRWMMPGGGNTVGVDVDANYFFYMQRTAAGQYNLRKINLETGIIAELAPGIGNRIFTAPFSNTVYGMALLNGKLYVSDSEKGKVFVTSAADPKFETSFDVPGASSVTADAKNNLLWVIGTGGQILALDPISGAQKFSAGPVPGAKDLSARNGRLAVLSTLSGKITVYDNSDPAHLRQVLSIGTGDGPAGPQQPDRFWFQNTNDPAKLTKTNVSLNSVGEVAVVDGPRVSFWGADGKLKKQGLGFWGQHNYLGRFAGDDDVRIWGIDGSYSIKMDSKNKHWMPDTLWEMPKYRYSSRTERDFFSTGGKNFGLYRVDVEDTAKSGDGKIRLTDFENKNYTRALVVLRMDAVKAVPVTLYYFDSVRKTLVELHDSNHDGIIDQADDVTELHTAAGGNVNIPWDRYEGLPRPNGDLVFMGNYGANVGGQIIKMKGLDPTGTYPVMGWTEPEVLPNTADGKTNQYISPYDYKTKEASNSSVQSAPMSDGGYASSVGLRSSGGTGLANGAGTDIAGFSKSGLMRWFFKLNTVQGSEGVQSIPEYKMVMGMTSTQCDYMVMDEDGLGMGVLSPTQNSHWNGMWSDHAQQQQAWVGNDGKPYYILGDYSVNGFHWYQITGTEKTKRQTIPVTVSTELAANLANLPALIAEKIAAPPTTKVTVARLAAPMPIDGDLAKWRNITPAALVTPETGTADIVGPADCSALIRLAYQGTDLYVQTIVFDDVVTFHQPLERMYQEDGIEMGLNSYMQGFKYNIANTTDHGPTVFRNKFAVASGDKLYTADQVPRSIKVYDDASKIEERSYIEAIYGVDLSKSKVIVTEFKLPLTGEVALANDPKMIEVAPGNIFWIGFFLNDNDMPGGDLQKFLAWPATYGTFAVKEAGALATFE